MGVISEDAVPSRMAYLTLKECDLSKVLVTGAAGFIGFHTSRRLLADGHDVVGLDNINDYYDVRCKHGRLEMLNGSPGFRFVKMNLADRPGIKALFANEKFDRVINLAAYAGVRHSLEHPEDYVDTNLVGFGNILEGCRRNEVEHLVYASSSSVYGANKIYPSATATPTNHPVSFYAATKMANEAMAHSYSHMYGLKTTGLRFFTVYGPWGRPAVSYTHLTLPTILRVYVLLVAESSKNKQKTVTVIRKIGTRK